MKETKDKLKKTKEARIKSINEKNSHTVDDNNVIELEEKRKSTVRRFTIGSVILSAFMLLYIPSLINWISGNNTARDIVRNGIIEESINADAVIIRNEELLKPAATGGRLVPEIEEGEKTPAFSHIATILGKDSLSILKEIEDINTKIIKARMEKAEKADFFSEDLVKLDKEIGEKVKYLIEACNTRDFEKLSEQRTEIGKIVEKKAEIVGESTTDNYINNLNSQKKTLQSKLNKNTSKVISNISGIVSYAIDGYENLLTPESLPEITPALVESILSEKSELRNTDTNIAAGDPPAKIIKGTDIYIAAVLDTEQAKEYKEGNNITIRINDVNIETTATITNVNDNGSGKTVVTVRTSRGTDILSNVRKVNVDFITKKEEGLKVPVRCLRNFSEDGKQADIMLIKFNVAYIVRVDITCRNDEYAIVRTSEDNKSNFKLNLYDIYIINPDNIKEGDIVQK